jgi:hypothetical protein
MSLETYKALHLIGLILLMFGLGGSLLSPPDARSRRAMMLHGIGALLMLVAGFGAMAKGGYGGAPTTWPVWLILKMVVWAGLAVLPLLVRKGKIARSAAWILALVFAGAAAWLGAMKPVF